MISTMRPCLGCQRPVRVLVPGTEICRACRPVFEIIRSGAVPATMKLIRTARIPTLQRARDLESGRPDCRKRLVEMLESEMARRVSKLKEPAVACRRVEAPERCVARADVPPAPVASRLETAIDQAYRRQDWGQVTELVQRMNRVIQGGAR